MTINFFLALHKANKKGLCPVWCRVTYNGRRANILLEFSLQPAEWHQPTQIVVAHPNADSYNNAIHQLRGALFEAYTTLKRKGLPICVDTVKQLATTANVAVTFADVVSEYRAERKTDTSIKTATLKNIEFKLNNILDFLRATKRTGLPVEHLNTEILNQYRAWLRRAKNSNSNSYANKCLYLWQSLERYAYGKGYTHRLNLLTFNVSKGFSETCDEVPHLTINELATLEQWQAPNECLQRVADLFLFQCYTGMAYADTQLFSPDMINQLNGISYIKYYRAKLGNKRALATPVVSTECQNLIAKYNGVLPKITNQKYNQYLKVLQAAVGVQTKLTSHVGRKTFGMLMLNHFGYSMEDVSRMLGHATVKMTERVYARVTLERVLMPKNVAA